MSIRTDLAMEVREQMMAQGNKPDDGVIFNERRIGNEIIITNVEIKTPEAAEQVGKEMGKYVTIESTDSDYRDIDHFMDISNAVANEIKTLLEGIAPKDVVLVVGLGNKSMTPDALGPKTVDKLMVTRHIYEYLPKQVDERMRPVCALSPGVLGVTGIESADIVKSICDRIKPKLVIVIDALAARRAERISSTVQLSNSGISPGAGIGNKRNALTQASLGIPVIAIGIPMVVYASTLVVDTVEDIFENVSSKGAHNTEQEISELSSSIANEKLGEMVVTPKEIDVLIEDGSRILSDALNMALHRNISIEEVRAYML